MPVATMHIRKQPGKRNLAVIYWLTAMTALEVNASLLCTTVGFVSLIMLCGRWGSLGGLDDEGN